MKFILETKDQEKEIWFDIRRMINAGYTGRDQEKVRKHIEELKKEGVPAPQSTPTAYEMITERVYFDREIEVIGRKTSGEAEYVLLCSGDEIYVGVGSDHTDRELESVSIIKSKQICPNLLSDRLWRLEEVKEDWDDLILKSWVMDEKGQKVLYQESALLAMMRPESLMDFVRNKLDNQDLKGVVIFSGTIPALKGEFVYSPYFEVELFNPQSQKRLSLSYQVQVLDYLKGASTR